MSTDVDAGEFKDTRCVGSFQVVSSLKSGCEWRFTALGYANEKKINFYP